MRNSLTLDPPPKGLGKRKFRSMYKASMGGVLKTHRKLTMKYHFEEAAFSRYSEEYKKHHLAKGHKSRQQRQLNNKNKVDDKFKAMHDRGNRAGILIFRRLLEGEAISDEEMEIMAFGGRSRTSKNIQRSGSIRRSRGRRKKRRPLVQSGLLEKMAKRNPAKIVGTPEVTSISMAGPFFLNLNPSEFNKREALTAVNKNEETALTKDFDRSMQKELDKVFN